MGGVHVKNNDNKNKTIDGDHSISQVQAMKFQRYRVKPKAIKKLSRPILGEVSAKYRGSIGEVSGKYRGSIGEVSVN